MVEMCEKLRDIGKFFLAKQPTIRVLHCNGKMHHRVAGSTARNK